jgi:hypothetical protein
MTMTISFVYEGGEAFSCQPESLTEVETEALHTSLARIQV